MVLMTYLRKIVPLVLGIALFAFGWNIGAGRVEAKWQQEVLNEYVKKEKAAADKQVAVQKISQEYQDYIAGLEGSTDRLLSDLRDDNKRLRVRVKSLSGTVKSNGRCESDGRAELDERDAKRILAVTQKADAWIKALQATIIELQKENKH